MRIFIFLVAMVFAVIGTIPAKAETRVERKIAQFGGPELRLRCVQEGWTWGLPYNCRWEGHTWSKPAGELRCDRDKIKTCTGHATDFLQHEFFLVATGPDAPQALKRTLERAVERALATAVAAVAATPGEVATKAAAGIAAFKIALAGALSVEPILASMKDEFDIELDERSHW